MGRRVKRTPCNLLRVTVAGLIEPHWAVSRGTYHPKPSKLQSSILRNCNGLVPYTHTQRVDRKNTFTCTVICATDNHYLL